MAVVVAAFAAAVAVGSSKILQHFVTYKLHKFCDISVKKLNVCKKDYKLKRTYTHTHTHIHTHIYSDRTDSLSHIK